MALLLVETERERLLAALERDSIMVAWWSTPVECASALARREREGALSLNETTDALKRLQLLARGWQEVLPSEQVRSTAQRLLRVHPLRAADSLQLAAAIIASEREPASLPFVCLDDRLNQAATREGFHVESD